MKRCPYQNKKKYHTRGDALIARAFKLRSDHMRAYRCPHCGFWHLTNQREKEESTVKR